MQYIDVLFMKVMLFLFNTVSPFVGSTVIGLAQTAAITAGTNTAIGGVLGVVAMANPVVLGVGLTFGTVAVVGGIIDSACSE